jgi:hypothetical protein
MNPAPKQITETLDSAGFEVIFDGDNNTWSIIDMVDEDGFRDIEILPENKQTSMIEAYEFVLKNIFRETGKKVDETRKQSIYITP